MRMSKLEPGKTKEIM